MPRGDGCRAAARESSGAAARSVSERGGAIQIGVLD
jgi:hypothetical protein